MNKNKGFTLIELLVVIAIIGILASVVLASLSSARNKGKDTAVKSQLASMRAQAELYYSTNQDSYAGICTGASTVNGFGDTTGPGLLKATQDAAGVLTTIQVTDLVGSGANITCHAAADSWVVDAPLVAGATGEAFYCVDATGASKTEASFMALGATACL